MPAEKFYAATRVEGDEPDLVVSWSKDTGEVRVNDVAYDDSALDRLITVLRRAKRQTAALVGEAAIALNAVQDGGDVLIVGPRTAATALFLAIVDSGRGDWERVRLVNGRESADHHTGGTLRPLTVDATRGRRADVVVAIGWATWTEDQRSSVAAALLTRQDTQLVVPDMCTDHKPQQHRDAKPPWCRNCGLTAEGRTPARRVFGRTTTPAARPERRLPARVQSPHPEPVLPDPGRIAGGD